MIGTELNMLISIIFINPESSLYCKFILYIIYFVLVLFKYTILFIKRSIF